jgi:hypothetical protein
MLNTDRSPRAAALKIGRIVISGFRMVEVDNQYPRHDLAELLITQFAAPLGAAA